MGGVVLPRIGPVSARFGQCRSPFLLALATPQLVFGPVAVVIASVYDEQLVVDGRAQILQTEVGRRAAGIGKLGQ